MTNMTQAVEKVLKTDAVGRVKTPKDRRDALLDEFAQSGLSGPKFASLVGIKYPTFATWVARRRKRRAGTPTPATGPVRWLEAVVAGPKAPAGPVNAPLKLHLPNGAWLELVDSQQVPLAAALLQAMQPRQMPC